VVYNEYYGRWAVCGRPNHVNEGSHKIQLLSLIFGILSMVGLGIVFTPLLGWENWIIVRFAGVGLLVSIVATATAKGKRRYSILGIVLCAAAVTAATIRLVVG
jgi:hypothetical protein